MADIKILCVGALTEPFYKDMQAEFLKRLSRYGHISVIEVADEKCRRPDQKAAAVKKECERLLDKMNEKAYNIALDIVGISPTSEELAQKVSELIDNSARLCFIIGGSYGLSEDILKKCRLRLSLSRLTLTHNMARLLLLEQLYRSFKIIEGAPYHK